MSYMKFLVSETPEQEFVMLRVFAGLSYEESRYAGTLVLPAADWELLLDRLIFGCAQMNGGGGETLDVYYGPDPEGET